MITCFTCSDNDRGIAIGWVTYYLINRIKHAFVGFFRDLVAAADNGFVEGVEQEHGGTVGKMGFDEGTCLIFGETVPLVPAFGGKADQVIAGGGNEIAQYDVNGQGG